MPVETVRVDWIQDQEFLLKDHFGFPTLMAQPMGVNGADLLPLSIIGCAAWDVVSILKKQRQQVTAFQVTAESRREDGPPWRFLSIRITYRVAGRNLKADSIRQAVSLTEEKYCATLATLKDAVEITSACEIIDSETAQEDTDDTSATELVLRFNQALNAGDVEAMMGLLTDDCVFENTFPAPDGTRYEGKPAVRAFWEEFFQNSRRPRIDAEEVFSFGDRCVLRWVYHWLDTAGRPGRVRGVDVYRIRNGLIQEKLSYVKG